MKVALRKETSLWEFAVQNLLAQSNLLKFVRTFLFCDTADRFSHGLPYEGQRSEA
jgi:hypothetical protein